MKKKLYPRWFIHFIACFIPKKKSRHGFVEKYAKQGKINKLSGLVKCQTDVINKQMQVIENLIKGLETKALPVENGIRHVEDEVQGIQEQIQNILEQLKKLVVAMQPMGTQLQDIERRIQNFETTTAEAVQRQSQSLEGRLDNLTIAIQPMGNQLQDMEDKILQVKQQMQDFEDKNQELLHKQSQVIENKVQGRIREQLQVVEDKTQNIEKNTQYIKDQLWNLDNKVEKRPRLGKAYIEYINFQINSVAELCDKYGSDKGSLHDGKHVYPWLAHTYAYIYELLFHQKQHIKTVFECGIGTNNTNFKSNMTATGKPGASLYVWRDFFPKAVIYGADIDKSVLFETERIKTAYMDQTNPASIKEYFQTTGVNAFDIIIDDGLHEFHAGKCLFENAVELLSPEGIYIIEDIMPRDLMDYQRYFSACPYNVKYIMMGYDKQPDNNLIIIRKY